MKKIYYVRGMIEWTAAISAGRATINIPFTGGSFTKYGNHPATFATSDPALQKIIENSLPFRQGRIMKQ